TWNANSISGKAEYSASLISRKRPDVIAIQETGRHVNRKRKLRLDEYSGIERKADPSIEGSRGLAILVAPRAGLKMAQVSINSKYCLVGKLVGSADSVGARDVFIVNVYIPGRGEARKRAQREVVEVVEKIRWNGAGKEPPGVIIMGDWNMGPETLRSWL